eukprot:2978310-Alexandrium_andersonii.AAC.1
MAYSQHHSHYNDDRMTTWRATHNKVYQFTNSPQHECLVRNQADLFTNAFLAGEGAGGITTLPAKCFGPVRDQTGSKH